MFEKLIEKIGKALANAKIPYMLIGGQAVLSMENRVSQGILISP